MQDTVSERLARVRRNHARFFKNTFLIWTLPLLAMWYEKRKR